MSAIVAAAVYDAFALRLGSFASGFSPPLPVSFPGVPFTPPDTGMWLEAAFFPNTTANYGLGEAGPFLHQGFLQASVCVRPVSGILAPLEVAGALGDYFRKGTVIGPVKIEQPPSAMSPVVLPDRLVQAVSIPYRALLADANAP